MADDYPFDPDADYPDDDDDDPDDEDERSRILHRHPAQAVEELHAAIVAVGACMEAVAKLFPGTTALAGIADGKPLGVLAFTRSREFNHFTPGAMDAARRLAQIVADLPDELLADAFRIMLRHAQERNRLLAEMEQARATALAAADKWREEPWR